MSARHLSITVAMVTLLLSVAMPAQAALIDDVNRAFRSIHSRSPSTTEWSYWAGRVQRKEKTSYQALVGAIAFQKSSGQKAPLSSSVIAPAAGSFKAASTTYASPYGPNKLPDGTLIKATNSSQVYYIQGGKRSPVIESVLDRWLTEAHFFSRSIIVTISPQDMARYAATTGRNRLYIGKVLVAPNGTQYYIDDKLRKRPLSASVRSALKFPSGNKYSTASSHLSQFPTGPALQVDKQPGGMIVYDGPYHGGRIWRIEEGAGGVLQKRLYLGDYFYEAEYYPDENQRVAASNADLAKYQRGANISTPPDGWLVGINGSVFVIQDGKRRHVTTPQILAALGYGQQNIIKAFPNFLKKIPPSTPIGGFKTIVNHAAKLEAPAAASSATSSLTKIKGDARALIGQINSLYRQVFDKEITSSENRFWADHIFSGEVQSTDELINAMQDVKRTGKKPGRTCRTCEIDQGRLKSRWFLFLFHHLHRRSPNAEETSYWHSKIDGGRNTIQKLDSNIQWLWQNERKTSK